MNASENLIALYERVRNKQEWGFSPYFFTGEEGKRIAGVLLRYVLEDKLHWTRDDICQSLARATFEQFRLSGMLKTYFGGSVFRALDTAYPGSYQPWELLRARRHVFSGEQGQAQARAATRWMVVDQLQYSTQDFPCITHATFCAYHLDEMLACLYQGSPWAALQDAGLCDNLHPWEVHKTPNGYWRGEAGRKRAIRAVRWLFEEKLQLAKSDQPPVISYRVFDRHGLGPMLKDVFDGSPFAALNACYPGRWKPWELRHVGNGFWRGEQGEQHMKEALTWLCEEALCQSPHQVAARITRKHLQQYGLGGLFMQYFGESMPRVKEAIRSL